MITESESKNCLNCGTPIEGKFCLECGQSAAVGKITFRDTINDFFSSSFALEGPLMSTVKGLVVNPGKLFREFISGRRKSYYKPVAFFVVLTAAYLIVRELINYDPFNGVTADNTGGHRPLLEAGRFMVANINNIMFFLVLTIGLCQKLFFWKKYNLAEYITIGFYISGLYILIGMVTATISVYIGFIDTRINLLLLFALIFYSSLSLHQRKTLGSILKYFVASLVTLILYTILGFGFSYLVVSLR